MICSARTLSALLLPALLLTASASAALAPDDPPGVKSQNFDQDPQWEGFRNVLLPREPPTTVQDFGWSPTSHASETAGEVGGLVSRSTRPAYYGRPIPARTLKDKLSASGTVTLLKSAGTTGVFFGWFNSRQQGFRPVNFVGFRLDGEQSHATPHVDYTTGTWKAGGLNTRLRIQPDGKRHSWSLSYDPAGAGTLTFVLDGSPAQVLELAPGHLAEGARFDRFGVFNQQTPGKALVAYFGNLVLDGKPLNLARDPKWESEGSHASFPDREQDDAQAFGYSNSRLAGGAGSGEAGGTMWRTEPESQAFGYYADRLYRLSMAEPLSASGKIALARAASDSGVYLGWFNSTAVKGAPAQKDEVQPPAFVGVLIEGPSRDGHYLRPVYITNAGSRGIPNEGPRIQPDGKSHTFTTGRGGWGSGAPRDPRRHPGRGQTPTRTPVGRRPVRPLRLRHDAPRRALPLRLRGRPEVHGR
jgi:hypothetical protein